MLFKKIPNMLHDSHLVHLMFTMALILSSTLSYNIVSSQLTFSSSSSSSIQLSNFSDEHTYLNFPTNIYFHLAYRVTN